MKKLLFFEPCLSTYRIDFFNVLAKRLVFRTLLTGGRKELSSLGFDLEDVNRQANFPYLYYSKGIRLGKHLVSFIYYRVIKQFRPDIVFTNELGINTLMSIFLRPFFKYSLFTFVDDSPNIARGYGFLRSRLRKFVIRHVDGFVVVNPQVRDFYVDKFKNYRCQYYYLPIIQDDQILADKFRQALPLSQQLFEQYSLSGTKVILFVARLVDIKVPGLLLKVFDELYQNNTGLRLAFIGDGILEKELKEYTATHKLNDAVFFTGRLTGNDLYAWYNIGQILVLPSILDRFGAVVNEALVAGCQAVVSDSVGAACLINETNGVVFKTNDHADLKNALLQTLERLSPLSKVETRNSNMEESFFVTMNKFIDFISK